MNIAAPRRAYRQTSRAAAAEATGERILAAFRARLEQGWLEEIRLEDIARDAGVTVQTVIRRFGGKEGLLDVAAQRIGEAVQLRRDVAPGDAAAAVRAVVRDYEASGDLIIRMLAQEDRYRAMRRIADIGRAGHRAWIGAVFEPWLDPMPEPRRRPAHDALVVATDLYVWKLVRRDMGRDVAELEGLMLRMIAAALGVAPADLAQGTRK
ncbi:MAG TPA: TetR family transcriptional regulator [Allosphingosinicella sp.]|jgi:AcrR family transcriptional regulator